MVFLAFPSTDLQTLVQFFPAVVRLFVGLRRFLREKGPFRPPHSFTPKQKHKAKCDTCLTLFILRRDLADVHLSNVKHAWGCYHASECK